MKFLYLVLFTFLFVGCSSKQVTVKSLQPSSIVTSDKIYNIILEEFYNDRINQTNYLEEKLVNMTVEGKRVFELQPTYNNVDAIITGEVLQSTVTTNIYFDTDIDYRRCKRYEIKDGKRTKHCLRYRKIRIPCERNDFTVKTNVQVLDKNERILFSKIYTKTKHTDECYRNRLSYQHPYLYGPNYYTKNEYRFNSTLAKAIANEVLKDISPHYLYQNITIIEELDKNYEEDIKEEFSAIVDLLDNGNINISQTKLHTLNNKLNFNSYEVLYNLALTYEAQNKLEDAKNYYIEAKNICDDIEDLKLINYAINRTQLNLENKIRAKSQLP